MKVLFLFVLALTSCTSLFSNSDENQLLLQTQNYTRDGGQIVSFDSFSEFANSEFMKNLQKKKDPTVAATTVIKIKQSINQSEKYLLFDESEIETDKDNSILRLITRRKVKFKEIRFGHFVRIASNTLPLSNCASSQFSSSGALLQLTSGWSKSLSLDAWFSHTHSNGYSIQQQPMVLALTASIGVHPFSFKYTSSSSIICGANPGETVQVMGTIKFASFPNAKQRQADFSTKVGKFFYGQWSSIVTENKHKALGMIMFDNSDFSTNFCSTDENLVDCTFNFEDQDPFVVDGGNLNQIES
jgi:hypothetical protein